MSIMGVPQGTGLRRTPPRYRGFTARGRVQRISNPLVRRQYAGGRTLPGAPQLGRRAKIQQALEWPTPPDWWLASTGEWIVWWYLTAIKRFKVNVDFYYQAPVFAPFLFSSKDFTRVDFLIDLGPWSAAGQLAGFTALCLDPITAFTHPSLKADLDKRNELFDANYLLVFLETNDLRLRTKEVMEKALRGTDISSRAGGVHATA